MTIAEQAFAYHVAGYSVIPLRKDKKPALASWKKYQTTYATDYEIIAWFENTQHQIGIVTGKLSGITVIDIDNKGEGGQVRADALLKKFPHTRTVRTPSGGYHLIYQYAEGFTVSANAYPAFPNVDIRGDTGYIMAAPSITDKGQYTILHDIAPTLFPVHLFPHTKTKRKLSDTVAVTKGGRNDSIASAIGRLLRAEQKESEWYTEVWGAIEHMNKTYSPPLSQDELKTTFDSIVRKEKEQRAKLLSPLQLEVANDDGTPASIPLRKSASNVPFKDMANAYIVLENHPYYKNAIKYNTFTHDIEYNGKPLEDADINKMQYFMQTQIGLHGISTDVVFSAVVHYAQKNSYDEAQDWLTSLVWDQASRLQTWLPRATGVDNDAYHQSIGSQWMMGIVQRIMKPGSIWDYLLVLVGAQGLGKTSLFRIIGGKWYKSFTGSVDNKDFFLTLRGAIIIDLDEGATLYRSEAIKIKSIITQTEDEFRAPYGRVMKKYPRRFVFSMSTNDQEPFRDVTGNRRYWVLDLPNRMVDFKWLEENRDQLFAEAYHYFKNNIDVSKVDMDEARIRQEAHLPDDAWTDAVVEQVRKSIAYCKGDPEYSITVRDIYEAIFPNDSFARLDRKQEMRIASILRKDLGLEKIQKMINGDRSIRWYISEKKQTQLQAKNVKKTEDPLNDVF